MDKIKFYNVKAKAFVEVDATAVSKRVYTRKTSKGEQHRYALVAEVDGMKLTTFVNKAKYDSLDVPVLS